MNGGTVTRWDAMMMDEGRETLRRQIIDEVDRQQGLQDHCFRASERWKWLTIGAGLLATVMVGVLAGTPFGRWALVFPALATAIAAIEPGFDFKGRSGWHCDYRLRLQQVLLDLDADPEADLTRHRQALLDADRDQTGRFPHGETPSPAAKAVERR